MNGTGLLSTPTMATVGQGMPPSGLLNTAGNYQFPLTSGLLSSVNQGSLGSAPAGVPNYSAMALQMAGNPRAGPYAPVPIPNAAMGAPGGGAAGSSGGGSSALAGLLTTAAHNPGMVKNVYNGLSGLLGGGIPSAAAQEAAINTAVAPTLASDSAAIAGEGNAAIAAQNAAMTGTSPGYAGLAADAAPAATAAPATEGLLSAGAPAADTAATAYGADLGAETATADAAVGADAAGAGASGAGGALAAAAPWALAALPIAAVAYGMTNPGTSLNSTWYNNFGNTVGAGLSPNATTQQKLQTASQLQELGLLLANGTGGGTGFSTVSDFNGQRLMDILKPYGITNLQQAQTLANQLINSIPPGAMPTSGAAGYNHVMRQQYGSSGPMGPA